MLAQQGLDCAVVQGQGTLELGVPQVDYKGHLQRRSSSAQGSVIRLTQGFSNLLVGPSGLQSLGPEAGDAQVSALQL